MTCRRIFPGLLVLVIIFIIFSFVAQQEVFGQINDENSLYTVALGAYKDGFYDLAIDQFLQLLKLYPNCKKAPYAEFRIAEAYFKQKKYDQALSHYKKVVNNYSFAENFIDKALYRMGQVYFLEQKYQQSADFYQRLFSQYSQSTLAKKALFWFAESNYNSGKYQEAIQGYQKFLQKYPTHEQASEAMYGLGWSCWKAKQYTKAKKFFEQLQKKYPKSSLIPKAILNIADIEYQLKHYKTAARYYYTFRLKYSDKAEARIAVYSEGLSYYQLQEYSKSINAYKVFLTKYSDDDQLAESVTFQLGFMYFQLSKYVESITYFEKIINNYKKSQYLPESYYYLGLGSQKVGKTETAEKYFDKLIKKFKNKAISSNALLHLGAIYYQSRRYSQAQKVYKSASRSKEPKIAPEAFYWLAETYTSQKKYDEALQAFLKIPAQYSKSASWIVMAQFRAASIYEHQGKIADALKLYEKVSKNVSDKSFQQSAKKRIEKIRAKDQKKGP